MNRDTGKKVVKFVTSGGLAALVEYVVFTILTLVLSIGPVESNTISFFFGLIVSFALNKQWVFKSKGKAKSQLIRYFLLALVNLVIGNCMIFTFAHVGVNSLIAKLISMGLIAVWNYLLFSRYIFKVSSL